MFPFSLPGRGACAALAVLALAPAGCARYSPAPVSAADYGALWRARTLDSASASDPDSLDPEAPVRALDSVSLSEAEFAALRLNPQVRLARARAGVAQARADEAGWWEDPAFDADILRFVESAENPWILGASIGFSIPLSGRLGVEEDLARAEWTAARWEALAAERELLLELREAWIEQAAASEKRDLAAASLRELETIGGVIDNLADAGALSRPEARVFAIERARRQGALARAEAQAREGAMKLKGLIGLAPEAPVEFAREAELGLLADAPKDSSARLALLEAGHPALLKALAEHQAAEETLRLEIRKQYPDLEIGPAFEREEGESRLGVGLSVPIPLWNRNRQAIAEAEAAREAARASFEAEYERLAGELAIAEEALEASREALRFMEETLAPLAAEQEAEVRRLAELGSLDALLLLEALSGGYEAQEQLVEARAEARLAEARLADLCAPASETSAEQEPAR